MYTIAADFSSSLGVQSPHLFVKADATGHMFSHFSTVFGTGRLFSTRHITGSPIQLRVVGGVACASTSRAVGTALSLCKQSIQSQYHMS
jgi:hypothetical protein